jgi:fatty-acyl-CoA synthase
MILDSSRPYDPVRWWAAHEPARVALVDREGARRWTYGELDALADGWAAVLRERGVRPGDRVALLAPNCVHACALLFAAIRTGAALVPLNWRLAPGELQAVLQDARPAMSLHHASLLPPPPGNWPISWLEMEEALSAGGAGRTPAPPDHTPAPRDAGVPGEDPGISLILYTSGSTGRPKGVMISQRQLLFNAVATCASWELGPGDVAPLSTPLFHTGGWNVFATPLWHCGGCVVLDRFDPATFLQVLEEEGCTVALAVPTQLVMLRAAADWGRPLPRLRRFFSGGAPCPPQLATEVRSAGYVLREGYGLTECGPNCFAISDQEAMANPGAVGRPVMFLEARLCDEAGRDVGDGEVGELCLRGPQLFSGYFDDPVRTAEALTADGWLRTGDLARRDHGGLFRICGRRKEMFISGGENVFPGEVEAALAACPGVAEVAVIGVPDPRWGEVGHAFVVAGGAALRIEELLRFARGCLAGYKVPRHVTLLESLPRLGSGKVDRRALLSPSLPGEAP